MAANWKPGWANEKIFSALRAEFCPTWPETLPAPLVRIWSYATVPSVFSVPTDAVMAVVCNCSVPTRWSKKFDPSIRLDTINTETWQTDVDGQTDVVKQIKKLSWCWQTRATRLEVSQGHQTLYCTIPYFRYSFILVFYRNFVPKTHRFEILNFNNAVTLKTGLGVRQGRWKYHHSIQHRTSYWLSIVTGSIVSFLRYSM